MIDRDMERTWTPIVGNFEASIANMISMGLLEDAPLEDKLDKKYRVSDLKELLEGRDIKAKGKKSELISAAIENTDQQSISDMVADVRLYVASESGKKFIETYKTDKEKEYSSMERDALGYLSKGDARRAAQRISQYRALQNYPGSQWLNRPYNVPETYIKAASSLIKYSYDDLPLNESHRKDIGMQLALSIMLGETVKESASRLLSESYDVFSWGPLVDHLKETSYCKCSGLENIKKEEVVELYTEKQILQAFAENDLECLSATHIGKGIRILPARGNSCISCYSGKNEYQWSEIDKIPKMPRHLGCHCKYVAWI
ncbi:hypothetical protein CUJ83_11280 [Methanocella sp. CWC-04]|uniref:SAP domain-containing protein n=1 Tax=Methanooceanicella nereidis TaxID=2052831 RepID=A0AAP2REX6_9EURY|nr:hypothetical protein [Methanocella sp. CWC-04]